MPDSTLTDEPVFHSIPTQRRRYYLRDKCCATCGSTEQLEIHHVDPSKKITHAFWGWPKERREMELTKCIVLCGACHRKVTSNQASLQPRSTQHGSLRMYGRYKCRCDLCVETRRAYNREYFSHYVRKEKRPV